MKNCVVVGEEGPGGEGAGREDPGGAGGECAGTSQCGGRQTEGCVTEAAPRHLRGNAGGGNQQQTDTV